MHFDPTCLIIVSIHETPDAAWCKLQMAQSHCPQLVLSSRQKKTRTGSGICRSIARFADLYQTSSPALPSLHTHSPATKETQLFLLTCNTTVAMCKGKQRQDHTAPAPLVGSHFQGGVTLGNGSLKLSFNLQQTEELKGFCFAFLKRMKGELCSKQ